MKQEKRLLPLLISTLTCTLTLMGAQTVAQSRQPENPKASGGLPGDDWLGFLEQLQTEAENSPAVRAGMARVKADKAELGAQRGDLGLSLSATYSYYPDGGGTAEEGSFTDLEERSEARLSLDLFDLLARRSSRIDSARAQLNKSRYDKAMANESALSNLMRDSIKAWSHQEQRQALEMASDYVRKAKRKLELSEEAALPEITKATPDNVASALLLHSQVKSRQQAISPIRLKAPSPPRDYSVLPLELPVAEDIAQLAETNNPRARSLRAESVAFREEAEALRGNGIELSVYGGYVMQSRPGTENEDGPQYGVQLSVPIGTRQLNERSAAEWQAEALQLEARAAIVERQRLLLQLRDNWAVALAELDNAQENMRQQSVLLDKMNRRAASPQAGQAPEPWEVELQGARFWMAVAEVWEKRSQWVQHVLMWGLLAPDYLRDYRRPNNPVAIDSLCAPLKTCTLATH